MSLDFDPQNHQYRLDGVSVPSVTQIVAPLGEDFDEPESDLELTVEAAADRGVTMHAYLAHRLMGGEPEDFELPGQYQPYAEAVEFFLSEHSIVPLLIETALPGPGYAGTPDLVAQFDGPIAILDYKFVSTVAKSRVGAQLGGYLGLCEHNGVFPEALYAVQFLPGGTYRLYPADEGAAKAAFTVCQALHEIKTKKHPRGRIE